MMVMRVKALHFMKNVIHDLIGLEKCRTIRNVAASFSLLDIKKCHTKKLTVKFIYFQ